MDAAVQYQKGYIEQVRYITCAQEQKMRFAQGSKVAADRRGISGCWAFLYTDQKDCTEKVYKPTAVGKGMYNPRAKHIKVEY
jgi:hypothetical protein